MAKEGENTVDQPNYLDMSDEDMMKMTAPVAVKPAETQETGDEVDTGAEKDKETPDNGVENDKADAVDTENEDHEDHEADEGDEETADKAGDEKPPVAGEKKEPKADDKSGEKAKPEAKQPEKTDPGTEIDYKAAYERLTAPFKANGRDVKVDSVDDAITLMQMGANYNKKMAALKPHLQVVKLLEKNDLLSEEKLSFLIELDRKNPEAINKLVKDSGLNPMDFDAEKAGAYKAPVHSVDEREIALDNVLDGIEHTPSYKRTLEIVSKEFDKASRNIVADNPGLIQLLNDHVQRGIYDRINAEVERQRMFGRLQGMSDLEAYRQVGDAMNARGGFNDLGSSQSKTSGDGTVVEPKPKKVDDDKLKDKKRAAGSSTAGAAPAKVNQDFNPLDLPDDEFEKMAQKKYR